MPPRILPILILICLVVGCAKSKPSPPNGSRLVKVSELYELNNTATMYGDSTSTWNAANKYFARSPFNVKSADKNNRKILVEFVLFEPAKYIDCGTFIDRIDGVEQEPIKYIQQVTETGPKGSDRVFGEATIYFSENSLNTTIVSVMATIHFQITINTYSRELTYENEIRFSKEMHKIGEQWVTISNPYNVEVPKYGPTVYGHQTDTRTARTVYVYDPNNENRIGRWGFDCHSTQKLEQMILQGIAEELQAGSN